jgi:hypothetical protein
VEHARELGPFAVPDRVGPGCYVGEVVAGVIAEERLEVVCGLRLDKVAGDVGNSDMPEACDL